MSPSRLKRIGYIRVSTAKEEQATSLASQRADMERAGCDEIIEDVQSGRDIDRPGYQRLLEEIIYGRVGEVLIKAVDRLGRNASEADNVIWLCAKHKVKLRTLGGTEVESSTPEGFVMSRISTTMAEVESRILALRTRRGLESGRKRRRPLRGNVAWGYRNNADRSALVPDPVEFPRAERFLALLKQCDWQLSKALTQWDHIKGGDIPLHTDRSVRVWLMNPVIRGGLGYGLYSTVNYRETIWDTHPALLSHEDYAQILKQFERNKVLWGYNNQRKPRLLTSLCVCGECHRRMSYAGSRPIPAVLCKTRKCPQQYRSTREEVIKAAVLEAFRNKAKTLASLIDEEHPDIARLRAEIEHLESLHNPRLETAIAAMREEMQKLHNESRRNPGLVELLNRHRTLTHLTPDELRELFQQLVSEIEIVQQQVVAVRLRI